VTVAVNCFLFEKNALLCLLQATDKQTNKQTRNKSNDYFESLQYRQDMRHIAQYHYRKNLPCLYTLLRKSQ